ncbi:MULTISPECIES: hypothetical protein [unclassified Streptomyces]|uniref:hypothetical protein n=1 Tax=unclassified Streptomyces TaxID=2593676 RepID=UPI00214B70C3|nr:MULTISPECIES: hypothetical protein [unclassified Streptomyces]
MSAVGMAWPALLVAVVVPAVVHALRRAPLWERISVPAPLALPLLVLTHAWTVLGDRMSLRPPGGAFPGDVLLTATAVLFWLPVVARTRHRLDDVGRCLYLFLTAPLLDLPAVALVATGDSAGGLTMIVGMLPVGVTAAAVTWSWVNREEREAERQAGGDPVVR